MMSVLLSALIVRTLFSVSLILASKILVKEDLAVQVFSVHVANWTELEDLCNPFTNVHLNCPLALQVREVFLSASISMMPSLPQGVRNIPVKYHITLSTVLFIIGSPLDTFVSSVNECVCVCETDVCARVCM